MGNGVITTTLPTRSARLLTIFPLFSRAFAPLPTVIAGSYRKARACVSYDTGVRFLCYVASALRYELLTLISSLAGGLAGRAKADGGAGGGMTRPAKAASGCLPWMLAGGHQALLPRISPLGTPIYSLWSNRTNLERVDVYQKYDHFVNFFHRNAF